ncbi:type I DNA topoisomerase [Aggregatibacter actinomycetemcomitans]|uniref:DNA topoisomerase family protein n=1 Tax=Aggregatibacter actinomycetemcomitans TaxID=714 RepID=UPI00197BDB96|nr:topoisomerase DNA-binding C4 zinc finger domain-containing protein [Aggregatibacter actinomycetemcomitans]MBN6063045.1 topoisomerase DNA-binding C4 zinc finger domain-containing protein [Aggregatibacter actinomycetemcomitans]MBN6082451.1 topoisomerase DNA-binding C4 zinc finger domain-containing protein [Aggregatibacter actinomycetemcomitans]MBN6082934.1 topoisomerase DNA-binding C4 zinc finger domain-containing protein [Aggregatibacter actinomycetemcomitans]
MSEPLFQATKHEEHCPQCGALLQIKQGKKGLFLGCSAYPQCDYLKPLHANNEVKILKMLEQTCPECGRLLALKQGHFGMFIGCSNYPNCHFVVHEEAEEETEAHLPCPECKTGQLVARRGRAGKPFYACNRFPHCKFSVPSKPYAMRCPQCHGSLALLKKQQDGQRTWQCVNKACRHIFTTE